MKRSDTAQARVRVEARLPVDLVAWLDTLASRERRDRTAQLEVLLREAQGRAPA